MFLIVVFLSFFFSFSVSPLVQSSTRGVRDRGSISLHVVHLEHRAAKVRVTIADVTVDLFDAGRHDIAVRAHLPRLEPAHSYHVRA